MYIKQLLKHINKHSLIEIVDTDFRRIYYGDLHSVDQDTYEFLTALKTLEINPFFAETSLGVFEPAIQVIVSTVIY